MEFISGPYPQTIEARPGLTMKGKIRKKEKCPKCRKAFKQTLLGLICPDCRTRPEKYFIDIPGNKKLGEERIRRYSDKSGAPLDSYERANRVLEHIRYEIDNHMSFFSCIPHLVFRTIPQVQHPILGFLAYWPEHNQP